MARQKGVITDVIDECFEVSFGYDAGVFQTKCSGSGIARIGEGLLAQFGLTLVHARKIRFHHQHLPAHIEALRQLIAMQPQRNRAHRAQIGGDILADLTVAAESTGMPEELLDTVRAVPGVAHASGSISVVAPVNGSHENLYLMGIDVPARM